MYVYKLPTRCHSIDENEQQANKIKCRDGLDTITISKFEHFEHILESNDLHFQNFQFEIPKFFESTSNFYYVPILNRQEKKRACPEMYKVYSHLSIMIAYHRALFLSFICLHVLCVCVHISSTPDESMVLF